MFEISPTSRPRRNSSMRAARRLLLSSRGMVTVRRPRLSTTCTGWETFMRMPVVGLCRTTCSAGRSLYTRSAIFMRRPRAESILCASAAVLPTRLGISTSRPWMAKRIAVMALKNDAAARMKINSAMRINHSNRSLRFISGLGPRLPRGPPLLQSRVRAASCGFVGAGSVQREGPARLFSRLVADDRGKESVGVLVRWKRAQEAVASDQILRADTLGEMRRHGWPAVRAAEVGMTRKNFSNHALVFFRFERAGGKDQPAAPHKQSECVR